MNRQTTDRVIMIRPTGFGYDPETAESNSFQEEFPAEHDVVAAALEEFQGLSDLLRSKGVGVLELAPIDPNAPNAVFPNNWFSTHAGGHIVLYPMATPSRRKERDPELAERLNAKLIDLSSLEQEGEFLEGTGSLVLDRKNLLAFACSSPRTLSAALHKFCWHVGYAPMPFAATIDGKADGTPIYHTNVMMSIGTDFMVICTEAIYDDAERKILMAELTDTDRKIIPITLEQMNSFAANILELRSKDGKPLIAMSSAAFNAFTAAERELLATFGELIHAPIPTIEKVGGGSVRCMLAENFLPLQP